MILIIIIIVVAIFIYIFISAMLFDSINTEVLHYLDLEEWKYKDYDMEIRLKSSKGVDNYDRIKFMKENRDNINTLKKVLHNKESYHQKLKNFLENNEFKDRLMYSKLKTQIVNDLAKLKTYNVRIFYISPAGRSYNSKVIQISEEFINHIVSHSELIMSKTELNKTIKEKNKRMLDEKKKNNYDMINEIIDIANDNKNILLNIEEQKELDVLISSLIEKTVNNISKIKTVDSEQWSIIERLILNTKEQVRRIIKKNKRILEYYNSTDFVKIKKACNSLIESQKDFNNYIKEKAESLSSLFGIRITRAETNINDRYKYIRPYKKSVTPFLANVSAQVFASAENNPLDYIVKYFYPNKDVYKEQIQKLQLLIQELETLKDARVIIDNYKKEYQKYFVEVPGYVLQNDKDGFYTRLGFTNISESTLTIEYEFSYTSNGGMAQRSFVVPMTEETIINLINLLQMKLSTEGFSKEQRALMTSKLRQTIKERDRFTCNKCGNSIYKESNLLLEIDHIVPISKGGKTVESNLQVLCWRCNRKKGNKLKN